MLVIWILISAFGPRQIGATSECSKLQFIMRALRLVNRCHLQGELLRVIQIHEVQKNHFKVFVVILRQNLKKCFYICTCLGREVESRGWLRLRHLLGEEATS